MTFKCMDRWTDPLQGRTSTPVGPFSCGRPAGHRGAHAHSGHGALALWRDGELLLALQQIGEPRVAEAGSYPEMEPVEALEGSVDAESGDEEHDQTG